MRCRSWRHWYRRRFVLAAVGVPNDRIAEAYALSAPSLDAAYARWLANQNAVNSVEAEALRRQATAGPSAMLQTLDYLFNRYGGAEEYLIGGGAAPRDFPCQYFQRARASSGSIGGQIKVKRENGRSVVERPFGI